MTEAEFFTSCAEHWDGMRAENPQRLRALVHMTGLQPGSRVLDVGSGTGVLLPYLHEVVGAGGELVAVDFSSGMLERARKKFAGLGNIIFQVQDVMQMPETDAAVKYDAVVSLNFFPHMGAHKKDYIAKMRQLLRQGGKLVIMHDISRDRVNAIHGACEHVREDRLPDAAVVAGWLQEAGYRDITTVDNDEIYFVEGHCS